MTGARPKAIQHHWVKSPFRMSCQKTETLFKQKRVANTDSNVTVRLSDTDTQWQCECHCHSFSASPPAA